MSALIVPGRYNLIDMSPSRLACLGALIECGSTGTCGVPGGALTGATLATLVMMGLAEDAPRDRLGGRRYRVTAAGLEAWDRHNPAPAAPRAKARSGPQGTVASTPEPDPLSFYPTPPWAARALAEVVRDILFELGAWSNRDLWWEPAAGAHHMAHGLRPYAPRLFTSDVVDYGVGDALFDFAGAGAPPVEADVIFTNPPFHDGLILRFLRRAYALARKAVVLLIRLGCLTGVERHGLFHGEAPLSYLLPFSERVPIKRGRWDPSGSTATDYCGFLFLKPPFHPPGDWRGRHIPPRARERLTWPDDARLFGVQREGAR